MKLLQFAQKARKISKPTHTLVESDATDPFDNHAEPTDTKEKLKWLTDRSDALSHYKMQSQKAQFNIKTLLTTKYEEYFGYPGPVSGANKRWEAKLKAGTVMPAHVPNNQYSVADDAPPEVRALIKRWQEMAVRHNDIDAVLGNVLRTMRAIKKHGQAAAILTKQSNKAPVKIAPANVPFKVPTSSDPTASKINNPYHGNGYTDVYAGSAEHYHWSAVMEAMYLEFDAILTRNGIDSFDRVYAGRHAGKDINFIAIAAGGDFVWRKYDVGGGSGQNHVWIAGNKISASSLTGIPPGKQDKLVKPLVP